MSEFLLVANKDASRVEAIEFNGLGQADSRQLHIVGRSAVPVAVAYDPVRHYVYWSDVKDRVIYRAPWGSENREEFLNSSIGIGLVEGGYTIV